METNNPQAIGITKAFTQMGIKIDKWETNEKGKPTAIYISVPEHSENKTVNGKELAGETLAKRFKQILTIYGFNIPLYSKIRKNEFWTLEQGKKAVKEIMKTL